MDSIKHTNYQDLVISISNTFEQGRQSAARAINVNLLQTYWQIGQYIVEFEQKGKVKADYGEALLERLSKDLSRAHGKGFSLSNIKRFRQFYLIFPNSATLSHQLSWSHYDELQIKYAMHNVNSQLYVAKYQLYLPSEQELRHEIERMYNY